MTIASRNKDKRTLRAAMATKRFDGRVEYAPAAPTRYAAPMTPNWVGNAPGSVFTPDMLDAMPSLATGTITTEVR